MASIVRRKGPRGIAYHCAIRRRGHPPICESLDTLADARAWAARTEARPTSPRARHFDFARVRKLTDLLDAFLPEAKAIASVADRKRALT